MVLQGLLLSWLIVIVSAETEILFNVPASGHGLWYWYNGAEWIHLAELNTEYRVCSDVTTQEPNNWLRTDFIDVRNAKRLDIEIPYVILDCPNFCKELRITLYSYHASTKQRLRGPIKGKFHKEAVITPKRLPPSGNSKTGVFRRSVVTRARGIYLAFLYQAVCLTLRKATISYRYCPEKKSISGTFPRTVSPVNDLDLSEQEGKCTDVNSVKKGKLSGVCLSNGEWNITDDLACLCKVGYEPVNGISTSLECKECPRGSYKSTISNTTCLQCPSNSSSNAERTACTCDEGFYNFKTVLEAGCKALPQAPLETKRTVVKATFVVMTWHRSPADNGKITYAVDCFRCKSGEDKNCKETCDQQVRYLPGKENITGVNVTVQGLSSSSFFLFRVYSVSELNQQEKDKNKWNYAEVFVETKATTTGTDKDSHVDSNNGYNETKTAASMHIKIIYGLLIVLVASVACYIVFKRCRHRNEARANQAPITDGSENRVYEEIPMLPAPEVLNHDDVILDSFELDRDQIKLVRILGTGNFGQVSKANYGDSRLDVAVKSLKENAQQKDIQDMLTELEVMKSMQPHPHVVRLIGCCTENEPLLIVLEYLPYGDLLGYLKKSRGHEDTYNTGEKRPNSRLTEKDLLSFAWMIADGMNYLATMKVVHRDLAARNVLVGENKVCKISDFGLARGLEGDVYTRRTQARLPVKWMPPESLFFSESSTMSDIWSYGIVMWEVFTIGESPYPGKSTQQVANLLQTGYRMPKPRHLSKELYSIMSECWEEQPRKRPTFQWLCNAVRRLLDDEKIYLNLEEYDDQEYVNFDMKIDE